MRIQHNIAALNSHRQLTSNNSAVGKNLEKLSSGNRDSLFLLDRYFLSVPALKRLNELNASGSVRMDLVTKAK